jgi:hypothetical protein
MFTGAIPEVYCGESASIVPSATLAAPTKKDDAAEKLRIRAACTLPADAIQIIPTKKFMGQWRKELTAQEKRAAARALERMYRLWFKHNKIENQIHLTYALQRRKVGHVNFNEQRKQIFFLVNTADNAIYLLSLGSKNSQRESIFRPSRELLTNLADMAKQCSMPLVSSFVLAPEGYFAIAAEKDTKGKMLGERLVGLAAGINGNHDDDDSDDIESNAFDNTVAKYIRDSIKACIDMFWVPESLHGEADIFADLVMSDVASKVKEHYGDAADMQAVTEMVKSMAGIAHAEQCVIDDRADREAAITSVARSDFDPEVFSAIYDKNVRSNLIEKKCYLQAFDKRARLGLIKLVEWYGGSDHAALKEFYVALACEVSPGSAMNRFFASCNTRDYTMARDNFRILCDRIEKRYMSEKQQIMRRVEFCQNDLGIFERSDLAIEGRLPEIYRTFKHHEGENLIMVLKAIPSMTSLSDSTQALQKVLEGIQTLKSFYALEQRIADIDSAIAGLPQESDHALYCHDARRMLDTVITFFVSEPFDEVMSECEQLIEQIESMIESDKDALEATIQAHVVAWGDYSTSVLDVHQQLYADYAGVIAEADQGKDGSLPQRELLRKCYDEFIEKLYPLAEAIFESRDEQTIRQHLTHIKENGYRLIESQFDKDLGADRRKQQERIMEMFKAWTQEQGRFIKQFGALGTMKYPKQESERYAKVMRQQIEQMYGLLNEMARLRSSYHISQLQDEVCVQALMDVISGLVLMAVVKKPFKTLCMSDIQNLREHGFNSKRSVVAEVLKNSMSAHGLEKSEEFGENVETAITAIAAMGYLDVEHDPLLVRLSNERYFVIRVYEFAGEWLQQAIAARNGGTFVGFDLFSEVVASGIKGVSDIVQSAPTYDEFLDQFRPIDRALKYKMYRLYQPENMDVIDRLINKFSLGLDAEPLEDA